MSDDFCAVHGYEYMTTQFGNPIPYCAECDRTDFGRKPFPEAEKPSQKVESAERAEVLDGIVAWLDQQRAEIGCIDGYDYRSGEEYGLRRAQIHIESLINRK